MHGQNTEPFKFFREYIGLNDEQIAAILSGKALAKIAESRIMLGRARNATETTVALCRSSKRSSAPSATRAPPDEPQVPLGIVNFVVLGHPAVGPRWASICPHFFPCAVRIITFPPSIVMKGVFLRLLPSCWPRAALTRPASLPSDKRTIGPTTTVVFRSTARLSSGPSLAQILALRARKQSIPEES